MMFHWVGGTKTHVSHSEIPDEKLPAYIYPEPSIFLLTALLVWQIVKSRPPTVKVTDMLSQR